MYKEPVYEFLIQPIKSNHKKSDRYRHRLFQIRILSPTKRAKELEGERLGLALWLGLRLGLALGLNQLFSIFFFRLLSF